MILCDVKYITKASLSLLCRVTHQRAPHSTEAKMSDERIFRINVLGTISYLHKKTIKVFVNLASKRFSSDLIFYIVNVLF